MTNRQKLIARSASLLRKLDFPSTRTNIEIIVDELTEGPSAPFDSLGELSSGQWDRLISDIRKA